MNDAVITVGDVVNEMRRGDSKQDFRTAYSNAVEEAVNRRLILDAAVGKKLEMQEWLVDNRVREIVKDNFGGDMNKLNAQLAQSKVALTDWRNQIRDDMIVNAMRFQMVDKGADPSPAEMHTEYLMHRDRYCSEAKTTVSVILLRPPADDKTPSVTTRGEESCRFSVSASFRTMKPQPSRLTSLETSPTLRLEMASAISGRNASSGFTSFHCPPSFDASSRPATTPGSRVCARRRS